MSKYNIWLNEDIIQHKPSYDINLAGIKGKAC